MDDRLQIIQRDFDDLALLASEEFDHNTHYHDFLLRQVPEPCNQALEIGCGAGAFSRRLAKVSRQVTAVDLSPRMIAVAKASAYRPGNLEFLIGDAMTMEFPDESFDYVASIATAHHLPMDQFLLKVKRALRTGGRFVVLDLFQAQGILDRLTSAVALPASAMLRLAKTGRLRPDAKVRAAWAQHAAHDQFLSLNEVRKICAEILPGATIKQHLFWRYSIVWKKALR